MERKSTELTDAPDVTMPGTARRIARTRPELWKAYQTLGTLISEAGPLSERERRLVHLAYALGSPSEGAAHSHVRRALSESITAEELEHVALLATTTLGWPQAVRALALVQDITTPS